MYEDWRLRQVALCSGRLKEKVQQIVLKMSLVVTKEAPLITFY